jgi:N4-gp56 family major capsid protein
MSIMTTGTAGLADTFKTMYAKELLMAAEPELIHARFGQRGKIVGGKTIEFRKFSALPTKTGVLTEGVTPNPDTLEITKVTGTAEQVGSFVLRSDLVDLCSYDDVSSETSRLQGDQAGRTYDYRTREVLNSTTSIYYAASRTSNGTITSSDVPVVSDVKKIVRNLRNNRAKPISAVGAYVAIADPDTEHDLLLDASFTDAIKNNSNPMFAEMFANFYIGRAWGVEWFRTTEAKVFEGEGNGGIDVHSTMFVGEGAFGVYDLQDVIVILKALGSGGTEDALDQRASQGWKGSFITMILFDAYMVSYRHACND